MITPNSDQDVPGFSYEEAQTDPQDQSIDVAADDYKDMFIEFQCGNRKAKYKWDFDKLK